MIDALRALYQPTLACRRGCSRHQDIVERNIHRILRLNSSNESLV